jgi:hypothetical protein
MKNTWLRIRPWLQPYLQDPLLRWFLIGIIAIIGLVVWSSNRTSSGIESPTGNDSGPVDTDIPAGFVLVPIEIQNREALSSLMDKFALVDLYGGPHRQILGSHLRLLRAPLNPNSFAVLVPQGPLVAHLAGTGPVTVVVQNPHAPSATRAPAAPETEDIQYYKSPPHKNQRHR